jgi:hypothetical protein
MYIAMDAPPELANAATEYIAETKIKTIGERASEPPGKSKSQGNHILLITMNYFLCPQAWDLLDLFASGIDVSEGDKDVYEKGIRLFSEPVSSDPAKCIAFAIDNNVAIWDFYSDTSSDEWQDQANDLWVSYLCREAG